MPCCLSAVLLIIDMCAVSSMSDGSTWVHDWLYMRCIEILHWSHGLQHKACMCLDFRCVCMDLGCGITSTDRVVLNCSASSEAKLIIRNCANGGGFQVLVSELPGREHCFVVRKLSVAALDRELHHSHASVSIYNLLLGWCSWVTRQLKCHRACSLVG